MKSNAFVKPDEQFQACLGTAMAKKGSDEIQRFLLENKGGDNVTFQRPGPSLEDIRLAFSVAGESV